MDKPSFKNVKDMLLCGILSSENVDSSGEIVSLKGMDISSLEAGEGVANYEHLGASDGQGREVVGRIVFVKKIFNVSDCEDDDERFFLKETRNKPYLFGIIRLADGAGHHEAQDLAAHIRDHVAHNEDVLLRYSIEGSTVEKENNHIKTSIARKVAMTFGPANRAVRNKILADPNAPEGFEKISMAKAEVMQDPTCRPIGGGFVNRCNPLLGASRDLTKSESTESVEDIQLRLVKNITTIKALRKTMTAGSTDCAPGTLTGGAALQREDLGKVYSTNVAAAVRDYDGYPFDRKKFKQHLKKYLAKASLPDISDSFLEHFASIAEASKLKKSIDDFALEPLQKKESSKAVLASPNESVIEDDRTNIPEAVPTNLTFRGKKLKKNPTIKGLHLDTNKGILTTPYGSLKLHNPATEAPEIAQHFQDCLNSPHTHKIVSQALSGWHKVHQLNKAGELPEEIPMTATILSTCSGNRPVPLTELQTVRIMDAMKNSGIDIRKPGFEHILPHLKQLDKPDVLPVTGGEAIGKDPAYYIGNKIGVERDLFGEKVGAPSTSQGKSGNGPRVVSANPRFPGELKTITPFLEDTVKNLSQYYKAHKGLVDLVSRHKTDMTAGIKELMGMKQARTNWQNRRNSIIASGKPDPGEYKGLNIPGIKLKTGLYAYGMLGGGNCLDGETEALTRRGWVKGFNLKEDDVLLTKNPETGELEWQGMTSLNLFPDYEGDLVEFSARSFDAITTPDHRWLVTSHGGSVKEKTSATITFNADRIHRTGSYVAPEVSGLIPDEAELLGWFVTDGFYKKKKIKYGCKYHKPNSIKYAVAGKYACLCQSTTGNPEKCARIDALVSRLDVLGETTTGVRRDGLKTWRLGPTLTNLLVDRSPNRYLPVESLLDLNKEALDRLRESMVLGDGWTHQHKSHWTATQAFCTGRKVQAEAFQVLLTMTGSASVMEWVDNSNFKHKAYASMGWKIPKFNGIYIVRELVREYILLEPKHKREFKAKMGVWCPTVPNSFFVARRNGKVWITGNSVVPDTHFIRHMFGLDTHKDSKTLKYLKNALWNPSNYHIIEKYNDWYRQHHPAHKWMVNHKDFKHMFDKPEDATFPSFWANWMNIPAYEAKLGTSYEKQANNAGSTHAPYWDAIAPHVNKALERLGKSESFDTTMPLRAALIMQQYVKDYGEIPAQMMYYQHLVPKLLECAKNRQDSSDATSFLKKTLKLEEELVELRKDIRHVVEGGHSVEMPEVYKVNMTENGKSYPAGRFMTSKGALHHLEDWHGLLSSMLPEGPINATTVSRIHGLMASPHFDVQEHKMPEGEPEIDSKVANVPQVSVEKLPEPKRAGVFSYYRPGMSKPHTVEFGPNGAALDGKSLSNDELALMLENARKGLAQVKWGGSEGLAKREATEDLMGQDEALQHVRAAVLAGHIHPSVAHALTQHIYGDSMIPGIGNKYAAQQFRKQNKPGVYASLDANDFREINNRHGHDAGDDAIKALGGALKDASAKVGTTKVFRSGGDEFVVHAPTHEHMSQFLRHAREHVEALPPIAGQHKQSFSVGLGHNFARADEALGIAKQGKLDPVTKQRLYAPGQTPNLGHSLYPMHEGPIMQPQAAPPKMAVG